MECFINHIEVNSCGTVDENKLYINQLPGISLKMIDSIVDAENKTFLGLWDDIQKRALRRFKKDYRSKFNTKYVGFCCEAEGCNPEQIACDNIELFEDAWMYCLGIELMLERMYSNRMTKFTTIDKDEASELKDYYTVEYEKSLNQGVKYIPKEIIDNCFECRSTIDYVESLP